VPMATVAARPDPDGGRGCGGSNHLLSSRRWRRRWPYHLQRPRVIAVMVKLQ
jgi:hypothetical protein